MRNSQRHDSVLFDQQHGHAGFVDGAYGFEDLLDDLRRKPQGWLVEKQKFWLGHERPADGEHLLLAAGKRAGILFLSLFQSWKHLKNEIQLRAERALVARVTADFKIFQHGKARKNSSALGRMSDAPANDLMRLDDARIMAHFFGAALGNFFAVIQHVDAI